MMGHIRYATVGRVNLSNVHPFSREMWGIQWCFCHNGEVPMFKQEHGSGSSSRGSVEGAMNGAVQHQTPPPLKRQTRLESLGTGPDSCDDNYYHPIGTTDSEALFCAMLNALRARFETLPSLPALYAALQTLSNEAVAYDPKGSILNYLLSCGPHTLWAYSCPGSRPGSKVWNGLYYTVREYPFSNKCSLTDLDLTIDFTTVTTENDCVSVIATAPLTEDEEWREIKRGELLVFDQGKPVSSSADLFRLELLGHGLHSTVLSPPILEEDMRAYNFEPQEFLMGEGI
jgi:predicted glutamine amidotransferase